MTGEARWYAVRRVNPFEGVLQVIETHNARAYSHDGRVWQVQVLAARPDHTWHSFADVPPIEQFFNFGLWDPEDGMQRIPANPIMDIGSMSTAADQLSGTLRGLLDRLPFTLIDDYECWATDYRGQPVALLATTEERRLLRDIRAARWQATRIADHGFVSPALLARNVPASGELGPRQHAEQLERQVRQLGQHRAWFRRLPGGGGERIDPAQGSGALSAGDFPALGLKVDWKDQGARQLATDYLAWQAPRLLTLQHIDDAQRAWLEPHACRRAVELAAVYRLIPRMLDPARIEAARVEARLRKSAR
ncbi:MAG: hypothetical protein LJE59_03710 [Chromatiaceae bacterium]|nr:hypothetical protein [Chromatiaceae bacterium]